MRNKVFQDMDSRSERSANKADHQCPYPTGDELVILLCGSDKSMQDETIKIAENLEGI
jgi:hypothetical protein